MTTVLTSEQTAMAGKTNSSAAKTGPIGATRALAREIARRNVLVNAVASGLIVTKMTEHLSLDAFSKAMPLGPAGHSQEVAGCVRFLCSELASSTTGQVLTVNDGPSI